MIRFIVLLALAAVVWRYVIGRWPWQARLAGTTRQQSLFKARKLLGVGERASRDEIVEAHRRRMALVHPDRGGTAGQVHEANAARDLLLAELPGE